MIYLLSNSDEGDAEVKLIHVVDQGSRSQCAKIVVGGVFLKGIVDIGADITILGGDVFKQIASVAKFKKGILNNQIKCQEIMNSSHFISMVCLI